MKSTLADWTATGDDDDDVNGFYAGEKRQRGGRKKRKKNKEEYAVAQDWDDIYDPTRPNSYEEYKNSDEKIREVTEWKDRLYAHRKARKPPSDIESDEDDYRPQMGSMSQFFCNVILLTSKTNSPHHRITLLLPHQYTHLLGSLNQLMCSPVHYHPLPLRYLLRLLLFQRCYQRVLLPEHQ